MMIRVGTAGWSIPQADVDAFPTEGSSLERYAARFNSVEINSSFHRPHRRVTYERWAAFVAKDFRFSVKLPKTMTHQARLVGCEALLDEFLGQVAGLGVKLSILLVQLPPSLAFEVSAAADFFGALRARTPADIACEPRHPSWFEPDADALLVERQVARVAADPAIVPQAALPGGWTDVAYWRLHGSPQMYRSVYADRLDDYAQTIRGSAARHVWCMFDNTASGAATGDALALQDRLDP